MYTLVIDQGTSSSRAILFSMAGEIIKTSSYPVTAYYPKAGWVEQCPEQLWENTLSVIQEVGQAVSPEAILAIGITNQRETSILWNKQTGKALSKAIVWQDRRTQKRCDELKDAEAFILEQTGLKLDPYFSASKLEWLLNHHQLSETCGALKNIAFGTVDSFLLWRMTHGKSHKTDITNASRTLLFNIHQQQWDEELLKLFNIPASILPEVCDSDSLFGYLDPSILGREIPICAMIGDQQSALLGIGCVHKGQAKVTYGTGGFIMQHTGTKAPTSTHGLLATIAYRIKKQTYYALEGNIYDAGSSMQWLKEKLQLFSNYPEADKFASSLSSNEGVYFIPAFSGIGAPHWISHSGASFIGLNRNSSKAHMIRAVMESIAYQTQDILQAMKQDSHLSLQHLLIDGGLAHSQWLIQFVANLCQLDIKIPDTLENTAKGAAMIATLTAGSHEGIEQIAHDWQHYQNVYSDCMQNLTHAHKHWLEHLQQFKLYAP